MRNGLSESPSKVNFIIHARAVLSRSSCLNTIAQDITFLYMSGINLCQENTKVNVHHESQSAVICWYRPNNRLITPIEDPASFCPLEETRSVSLQVSCILFFSLSLNQIVDLNVLSVSGRYLLQFLTLPDTLSNTCLLNAVSRDSKIGLPRRAVRYNRSILRTEYTTRFGPIIS